MTLQEAAELLLKNDNILIIAHKSPDGDTTGSSHGLYYALKQLGKKACVVCSDEFPKNLSYMYDEDMPIDFEHKFIVTVDIADTQLIGDKYSHLADKIDLCLDHHFSNKQFAKYNYVDIKSASACEIIFDLIETLKVDVTPLMADCVYTGVITDTGCFKFSNTTPRTHRIAAKLFEYGCNYEMLNRNLFEVKSVNRLLVEKTILENMELFEDNKIAVIEIPTDLIEEHNIDEGEIAGISAITRQIEGVEVGVSLKKKDENSYKVSLRSSALVDSSLICSKFGGGGHKRAAGCVINKDIQSAKQDLIAEIKTALEKN